MQGGLILSTLLHTVLFLAVAIGLSDRSREIRHQPRVIPVEVLPIDTQTNPQEGKPDVSEDETADDTVNRTDRPAGGPEQTEQTDSESEEAEAAPPPERPEVQEEEPETPPPERQTAEATPEATPEAQDTEAEEQARREAAEREAAERARREREAAEERARQEREAAERARREREAAERARREREAAERERQERERRERERAERERQEREAAERARRERERREQAERERREREERQRQRGFASVLENVDRLRQNRERGAEDRRARPADRGDPSHDSSRPLSMSEIDAVRRQLTPCWNFDAGAPNARELRVSIRLHLNRDGSVQSLEILDRGRMRGNPHFRAAAESARRAVLNPRCMPLELPPEKYATWRVMVIEFDPSRLGGH